MSNIPRTAEEYRAWFVETYPDIEYGRCVCSPNCDIETSVASGTDRRRLWFKGEPIRYAQGHAGYNKGRPECIIDSGTGCWVWQRAQLQDRNNYGSYGAYYTNGRYRLAHVVFYERYIGPVPEGMELDHKCRNPLCVNFEHLEPVPHAINSQRGNLAKLNPDQVREIRALHASGHHSHAELANMYEVTHHCIKDVVHRRSWRNI